MKLNWKALSIAVVSAFVGSFAVAMDDNSSNGNGNGNNNSSDFAPRNRQGIGSVQGGNNANWTKAECANRCGGAACSSFGESLNLGDKPVLCSTHCKAHPLMIASCVVPVFFKACLRKDDAGNIQGVVKTKACEQLSFAQSAMISYIYSAGYVKKLPEAMKIWTDFVALAKSKKDVRRSANYSADSDEGYKSAQTSQFKKRSKYQDQDDRAMGRPSRADAMNSGDMNDPTAIRRQISKLEAKLQRLEAQ